MIIKDKMQILAIQSYLKLGLGAFLSIFAIFNEKQNVTWAIAFLFAGMIGISAYEAISKLAKRISALEKQSGQGSVEGVGLGKEE